MFIYVCANWLIKSLLLQFRSKQHRRMWKLNSNSMEELTLMNSVQVVGQAWKLDSTTKIYSTDFAGVNRGYI